MRMGDSADGSDTDYEFDEELENILEREEAKHKSSLEAQCKHLLEFSEGILPTALYKPMKWCHVLIRQSLEHIAKTEEILRNMGSDSRLLERELEREKEARQTCTSKSRLSYSLHLFQHAGDAFYAAFYQNRKISPEIRTHLDRAFEAQFGSPRLNRTRSLLKLYLRQYSQIEDFHAMLPDLFRSEALAGLITDYLNPLHKEERGVVEEKVNELLFSPDYHENQITLMLLTQENCAFRQVVVEAMLKYIVTDPLGSASATTPSNVPSTSAAKLMRKSSAISGSTAEDKTRYRLKMLIDSDPEILIKACRATEPLSTSLFDIIISGLDVISKDVMLKRSRIFEDFRPPLFDGNDSTTSLSGEYFKFFRKLKNTPSDHGLLGRVKNSLGKIRQGSANTGFWMELFALLNDPSYTEHYS